MRLRRGEAGNIQQARGYLGKPPKKPAMFACQFPGQSGHVSKSCSIGLGPLTRRTGGVGGGSRGGCSRKGARRSLSMMLRDAWLQVHIQGAPENRLVDQMVRLVSWGPPGDVCDHYGSPRPRVLWKWWKCLLYLSASDVVIEVVS